MVVRPGQTNIANLRRSAAAGRNVDVQQCVAVRRGQGEAGSAARQGQGAARAAWRRGQGVAGSEAQ